MPYVISADTQALMERWGYGSKHTVPDKQYFADMLKDLQGLLQGYFPAVEVVPERQLRLGLLGLAQRTQLPIVSLDRAYIHEGEKTLNLVGFLDVTRAVNPKLEKLDLRERPGSLPVTSQLDVLARKLRKGREIALADDVIFEGGTHQKVAQWFAERDIIVKEVLSGITIEDGRDNLENAGIRVKSVIEYAAVVDEVCERDYTAGVPMSGRSVVDENGRTGSAPYFSPFGIAEKWASIPAEHADEFSAFCMMQSIALWSAVERLSKTEISTSEIPRPLYALGKDRSIVTALKSVQASMR